MSDIELIIGGMVLERAGTAVDTAIQSIRTAANIGLIVKRLESLDPNNTEDADRDAAKRLYGLRARGQKTRERLNQQAKDILARIEGDPAKLTDADRDILMQYSGRGGLQSENSLSEYYTPPEIAEGTWDMLKSNGFENGNVCEPSTGAGVFLGTKPAGVKMVGTEIDPTSSGVASVLNPDDVVRNQSFEQLCAMTADDTFDAMIGNVPFGDTRGKWKQYDPDYQDIKEMERYFVTRAVDKVKPGGLVCLIVPPNIVGDRSNVFQKWRRTLSLKAEFLGAHKLPSGTFGGQNGNGTDTVVDVLVMRKHSREILDKTVDMAAADLEAANVYWPTWIEGDWFRSPEGKRFIHGEVMPGFRGDIVKSDLTNAQLKTLLARKFDSRINFDLLGVAPTITRNYSDGDRRMIAGVEHELVAGEWVKVEQAITESGAIDQAKYGLATLDDMRAALEGWNGALVLTYQQAEKAATGEFMDMASRSVSLAVKLAQEAPEAMRERVYRAALIGAGIEQYTVALNRGEASEAELERLQKLVTAEVGLYGNPANDLAKLILNGEGANRVAAFATAVTKSGGFNDLLAGKVERGTAKAYDSNDFADIVRHLSAMNGKPVALEDAQALYTGERAINSLDDAAAFDQVAVTVNGLLTTMRRYVAGNVVEKTRDLQAHIASNDETPAIITKWKQQLEAIQKARKIDTADDITFALRGKWYSRRYLEQFLFDQGYTDLEWSDTDNQWLTQGADGFEKQLGNFINGQGVSAGARTSDYRDRIKQLEEQFNIWMRQQDDIDELVTHYNDTFNAHLPHEYDETDLGLEGVSEQVKPHGYQNAAVRRLSEEGRGILGLDTGLGKTFSALALAAYNKQQGRAKRTCIVVPKAVLENWYHEAKQFYGNLDNALFVGFTPERNKDGVIQRAPVLDENGQPRKNRHTGETEYRDVLKADSNAVVFEKMHQIPTTSASLVIMTKERFGEIPMRPETRESYTDKMASKRLLSDARAKEFMLGEGGTKGSYSEAKKSEKYQEMYSREGSKKKNQFPYFEQMGFDSVIVDEGHEFKNAFEANSQTARLAYLPTSPASKRSIDMAAKMAYLREHNAGRGPVLLSATPVTNSPTEIFNMLSYVMDIEEFESMGINSVDDFIGHYCDTATVDVVKLSGKVEAKEAVTGFRNLGALRTLFKRFTNIKKAADVNDDQNSLKIPDAVEMLAAADMLPEQRALYEELRLQAEGIEIVDGEQVQVDDEDRRPVFAIIRDMDRVTTDLDLYYRRMTFTFAAADLAKVDQLVADLPQTMRTTLGDESEGEETETETVSLDSRIEVDGNTLKLIVPEGYENEVVSRIAKFGITENTVAHPVTPKYAKMLENLRTEYERGGKQIVFTEEKTQHNKIKRLITHHLPVVASEIEIINAETASGDKLEKISAAYNTGKAKIVIANRKAEVGVNLQRGTTAIHHLTLPWTPASIQQRNGRGVRQGNSASKVEVFYYLGKGSFDQYRLDMLKRKADWLDSLFNGTEARAENANAGVSDEYAAMLAANPEEFKRRIEAQKADKASREREQRNTRAAIDLHQLAAAKRVLAKIEERRAEALDGVESEQERAAINARFDAMRDKNQRKVKMLTDGLLSQQDGGKIDVDAKTMIEGGQYVVDTNGMIIRAGGFYQYFREGRVGGDKQKVIFEAVSVDPEGRTLKGRIVLGNDHNLDYGWRNNASMAINRLPRGIVEVKLNRQQLAQERMAAKGSIEYSLLFDNNYRVGAEWLAEMQHQMNGSTGLAVIRTADGGYVLKSAAREPLPADESYVYPELDDAGYREIVGRLLVPYIAAERYSSYEQEMFAEKVFGKQWREAVAVYGKQANAAQIERIATESTEMLIAAAQEVSDGQTAKLIELLDKAVAGANKRAKQAASEAGYSNVVEIAAAAAARINALLEQAKADLKAQQDAEKAAREARLQAMMADAAKNPDANRALEVTRNGWVLSGGYSMADDERAQIMGEMQLVVADTVMQLIQSGLTPAEVLRDADTKGQRARSSTKADAMDIGHFEFGSQVKMAAALTLFSDVISPARVQAAIIDHIGNAGEFQVKKALKSVVNALADEMANVEPAADQATLIKSWRVFSFKLTALWNSKNYSSGLTQYGDFSRKGPRQKAISAILATCQAGFMARFGGGIEPSQTTPKVSGSAIPDGLIAAFDALGIEAKTNTASVMWASRNKGKPELAEPGTRLFLFDPKGRSGPLNEMAQGWLKSRYGAVWSADFADGFKGLWWHISLAGVDFEALQSLVAKS